MTVKLNLTIDEKGPHRSKKYATKKGGKKSFVETYGGIVKQSIPDIDEARDKYLKKNEVKFGSLKGKLSVPANFDDELKELREYK